MTQRKRDLLAWAINLLSAAIVASMFWWSFQTRAVMKAELQQAQVIADSIMLTDTGVVGVDDHGQIVEWNHAAEKLTGYPGSETIGYGLKFLIPLDHQQAHLDGMKAALKNGEMTRPVQIVTCSIVTKNGETLPIVCSLRMLPTGPVRFLVTMNAEADVLQVGPHNAARHR